MDANSTFSLRLLSLTKDLRQEILKRLKRPEILCLRAVSQSFRNTIPLPPKPISPHPELVIPFCTHPDSSTPIQLLLTVSTVYAIQPIETTTNGDDQTNTWIVRLEELSSGVVRVKDTLYKFKQREVLSELPRSLNMLDYRVQELSKVFGLVPVASEGGNRNIYLKKVVVSSYPDESNSGFTLLALTGQGIIIAWRKGDHIWNYIAIEGVDETPKFEDIVYYNSKFYAVLSTCRVVTIDPLTLEVTKLKFRIEGYMPTVTGSRFLVKSSKDLFWICKCWSFLPAIDPGAYGTYVAIIKLDEKNNQWIQVNNELEDEVLFIGEDCSFSLPGKGYTPCKPNTVYFIDEELAERGDRPGTDIGILEVDSLTAKPIYAFPGYSKIFWPPPPWVRQNESSSSSTDHE
ncbi:F-box protein SKIP23-like [Melia azedarach]|uniref:F-box protein SKIP23-like n=1 Tax=Melia azedarach TaxID=155640 RepID=A0ACC1XRZ6_MELAZ|nr:F-box protein SKIP23-like [Melia azedarach]